MLSLSTPSNAQEKADSTESSAELRDSVAAVTKDSSSTKLTAPEVLPTFQGGDVNTFARWVMSKIVYPKSALDTYLEGRVTVSFIIERDGALGSVDIVESPSDILSAETLRVIISSPKWIPGIKDGKNVRVHVHIPVIFKLNRRHAMKKQKYMQSLDRN